MQHFFNISTFQESICLLVYARAYVRACVQHTNSMRRVELLLLLCIAQPICDKIWPNWAFYDSSIKFGTHLDLIITKIFGYRAISDFALEGVGNHFPR